MAYSESQKKATQRYNAKAYDRIEVRVPKGNKQMVIDKAASEGKGINEYLLGLLEKEIPNILKKGE